MLEERLLRLLDAEQLSSSKFADVISVQRSSVSHILSGRNKPSFDFLQKTLKAFPYLNADWLILGEGKMYNTEEVSAGGSLFDQPVDPPVQIEEKASVGETGESKNASLESASESNIPDDSSIIPTVETQNEHILGSKLDHSSGNTRTIKRVVLLYSDNSFETYESGN